MKLFKATVYTIEGDRRALEWSTILEQEREHLGKDFLQHVFITMRYYCDLGGTPQHVFADVEVDGQLIAELTLFHWTNLAGKIVWSLEIRDADTMRSCTTRRSGMEVYQ